MRSTLIFIIYLSLLSMLGFLATDMYLPAFAEMQQELNTSKTTISATLSLFLAGFACAQLFWGPLSDKHGRKPILIAGLTLFMLSCFAIILVKDPFWLLVLRFLQACGVCAATVCWQALVIDHFNKQQAGKIFATIMPLVALSPALAPLLGAWLLNHWHWKSIFIVLGCITLLLIIQTVVSLTPPATSKPCNGTEAGTIRIVTLLKHPAYMGNILIFAACSASFFTWLTASPFLLKQFGFSATDIGLSYIPQTIAFLCSGYACRAMLNTVSADRLLPWLLALFCVCIIIFVISAFLPSPNLTLLMTSFCGTALANGTIYPLVVARALQVFPEASGKAAALQNSFQLGLCCFFSLIVSAFISHALTVTASAMAITALLAVAGYVLQRQHIYAL